MEREWGAPGLGETVRAGARGCSGLAPARPPSSRPSSRPSSFLPSRLGRRASLISLRGFGVGTGGGEGLLSGHTQSHPRSHSCSGEDQMRHFLPDLGSPGQAETDRQTDKAVLQRSPRHRAGILPTLLPNTLQRGQGQEGSEASASGKENSPSLCGSGFQAQGAAWELGLVLERGLMVGLSLRQGAQLCPSLSRPQFPICRDGWEAF